MSAFCQYSPSSCARKHIFKHANIKRNTDNSMNRESLNIQNCFQHFFFLQNAKIKINHFSCSVLSFIFG